MSTVIGYNYGDKIGLRRKQNTVTASTTLTEAQLGEDFNVATDALVITLPLITASMVNSGMTYIVRNTGADGNNIITISPNAADGINGSNPSSVGANADATTADGLIAKASGTVNKDWVNTKATANTGDYVELKPIALTKWYVVDGVGEWASEA